MVCPPAKATSSLIAGQCSALLSPQELSNVVIGECRLAVAMVTCTDSALSIPSDALSVDFGEVVIGTEADFPVNVKNFLKQHLSVKSKV